MLAVAVRDQLPQRRARGFAVVLLALLGAALILAAFRVDVPMLSGGNPATWHGWMHGIAFLLIIATGALAPLAMAPAVRHDPGWRPIAVVSVAATVLFVVFLFLPWGNATFLLAIMTLFAWIAAIAVRLATLRRSQQDQQDTASAGSRSFSRPARAALTDRWGIGHADHDQCAVPPESRKRFKTALARWKVVSPRR